MLTKNYLELKHELNQFVWNFKKGDNILFNLSILFQLYESREDADRLQRALFNKPLIVIIAAIIECIMDDFIRRIKEHSSEKVPNLSSKIISDLRFIKKAGQAQTKELTKFEHFITQSEKHNLFHKGPSFYKWLRLLGKIRNRIHIQNTKDISRELPEDEIKVFTDYVLYVSEALLVYVFEFMAQYYPRPRQ